MCIKNYNKNFPEKKLSKFLMKMTTRALIFNDQNQLLTVQHHGSNFWSLPGGKIDEGEDLKTCLKREIFEELGLECEVKNLAFVHEFQWSKTSDVTTEFFFVVKTSSNSLGEQKFYGKFAQQELKKIEWNILDKNLDIKPEFLRNFSQEIIRQEMNEKIIEYFSYV